MGMKDLRLATLRFRPDGILEIRFKEGLLTDLEGVNEVVEARRAMSEGTMQRVMVILAADVDFELEVTTTNAAPRVADWTLAEATVATTNLNNKVARMYYTYMPHPFLTLVAATEEEAAAWLQEQA